MAQFQAQLVKCNRLCDEELQELLARHNKNMLKLLEKQQKRRTDILNTYGFKATKTPTIPNVQSHQSHHKPSSDAEHSDAEHDENDENNETESSQITQLQRPQTPSHKLQHSKKYKNNIWSYNGIGF